MSDFQFSINELKRATSIDKEYIEWCLTQIMSRVENAATLISSYENGSAEFDDNSMNKLMAARATLLFNRSALTDLEYKTKGNSDVSKYYTRALEKTESDFTRIFTAEFLMQQYFML